jgi:hypothetical protein
VDVLQFAQDRATRKVLYDALQHYGHESGALKHDDAEKRVEADGAEYRSCS